MDDPSIGVDDLSIYLDDRSIEVDDRSIQIDWTNLRDWSNLVSLHHQAGHD